jgi:hypothetical protein
VAPAPGRSAAAPTKNPALPRRYQQESSSKRRFLWPLLEHQQRARFLAHYTGRDTCFGALLSCLSHHLCVTSLLAARCSWAGQWH